MIIKTDTDEVRKYGEITEYKTSIDPEDIGYITTLLSSNLYSAPCASFLREIVSNAWDSHVEAGTTDTPILVVIKQHNYPERYDVTIRDFGTGIAPERFQELYCNIGKSTKRQTNAYIGGFGIGHFSMMAVSNSAYINSYYNGKVYKYCMVKQGNSITTNLMETEDTDEKNGLEISVNGIKIDYMDFTRALAQLMFFPNIYISGDFSDFNERKTKLFNNYAVYAWRSSISSNGGILLGNVLYPLNVTFDELKYKNFISALRYQAFALRFDIGELSITPNREQIIYTKDTLDKIKRKIDKILDEIKERVPGAFNSNTDDIKELYTRAADIQYYVPFVDKIITQSQLLELNGDDKDLLVPVTRFMTLPKYKGKSAEGYRNVLVSIMKHYLPNYMGLVYSSQLSDSKFKWSKTNATNLCGKKMLIIKNCDVLSGNKRKFIIEHFDGYSIFKEFNLNTFLDCVLPLGGRNLPDYVYIGTEVYIWACVNVFEYFDFDTSKEYSEFVEKQKELRKVEGPKIKRTILHVYTKFHWNLTREFTDINVLKKWLIDTYGHGGIVLVKAKEDNRIIDVLTTLNYCVLGLSQEAFPLVKSLNLSNFVSKEKVLSTNKTLCQAYTAHICDMDKINWSYFNENLVTKEINNKIQELKKACGKFTVGQLELVCPYPDPYTEYLCDIVKTITDKVIATNAEFNIQKYFYGGYDSFKHEIVAYLLLKTKSYRIPYCLYKEIKNNKIISTLCKK